MPGPTLIARWETWEPSMHAVHGAGVYPMFEMLVSKDAHCLGAFWQLTAARKICARATACGAIGVGCT